jgi:hypothetical protein
LLTLLAKSLLLCIEARIDRKREFLYNPR